VQIIWEIHFHRRNTVLLIVYDQGWKDVRNSSHLKILDTGSVIWSKFRFITNKF
jgi:hypothetical protein